ncbi:hypothetical protein RclHR1_03890004 [Rhizophagus clarus]|uniref:Uncharacterized protein n=1 Tax=Rhizophagus clarus TaxID=94130 RepID=A0A2Z6S895_9GLOM|nr:hypothetical protein RclHR1_03890004 [Rhizophagus clarus]
MSSLSKSTKLNASSKLIVEIDNTTEDNLLRSAETDTIKDNLQSDFQTKESTPNIAIDNNTNSLIKSSSRDFTLTEPAAKKNCHDKQRDMNKKSKVPKATIRMPPLNHEEKAEHRNILIDT